MMSLVIVFLVVVVKLMIMLVVFCICGWCFMGVVVVSSVEVVIVFSD